jgi:hypothetical protein
MKQLGERVLGLFVVREDDDDVPIETVEEAPPAPVADAKARVANAPPEAGSVDEVKKVMDLIAALPEGAPLEMKRAIVTASLEAFGIRIDRVLSAAAQAERGLEAQARRIDLEIAKQQEAAKSVARERAGLRAVGAFFGKT